MSISTEHFPTSTFNMKRAWPQKTVRQIYSTSSNLVFKTNSCLVGAYIYRLHLSIDHALAVSYRRDQFNDNAKFVARITLVKGVPFYGFHVGYRFFLKIYMYNPVVMTRLADLLQQGAILKRSFQPYESHLQYLAQFMIDYNLYGCDYLESSKTTFRAPVPDRDQDWNSTHLWHSQTIPTRRISDDLPRASHCSIEVDICVQDVTNRKMVKERLLHHDFIERTNPIANDVKLVTSMAGLWKDETRRRKLKMSNPQPGSNPFPAEALITMSADPRDSQAQGWIHEEEYRDQIHELINEEAGSLERELKFDTFVSPDPYEKTVNTALQSVEDLYPKNLLPILGLQVVPSQDDIDVTSNIEVDEANILRFRESEEFFPNDSDEEVFRELGDKLSADSFPFPSAQGIYPDTKASLKSRRPLQFSGPLTTPGIRSSALKTGKVWRFPVSQALIAIAEKGGYTGPTHDPSTKTTSTSTTLKRKVSTSCPTDVSDSVKRLKSASPEHGIVPKGDSRAVENPHSDSSRHYMLLAKPMSSQGSKSSPSSSDQGIASQILNFPVVKNPNAESTKLRLSQHSFPSLSQEDLHVGLSQSHSSTTKQLGFMEGAFFNTEASPLKSSVSTHSGTKSHDSQILKVHQAALDVAGPGTLVYGVLPPDPEDVPSAMEEYQVPDALYQDAYYSKEKDVPPHSREYAGREFRLRGNTLPYLPSFDPTGFLPTSHGVSKPEIIDHDEMAQYFAEKKQQCSLRCWEFAYRPPAYDDVNEWWDKKQVGNIAEADSLPPNPFLSQAQTQKGYFSQIDGPTPKNKHGFQYTQKTKFTSVKHEVQYMSTMSLEIHVNTRDKFVPNPEEDEIQCIFWAIKSDEATLNSQDPVNAILSGIIVFDSSKDLARQMQKQTTAEFFSEDSELDLMVRMVEVVRAYDPDVLTGYEVHGSSWGYLIERARLKYDYDLCDEFSRMKADSHGRFGKDNDKWGFNTTSTIRVTGRHMINVWRAMRGELNLLQYTMENVVWHVLHRRIPHYSWKMLTTWYKSGNPRDIGKILRYYCIRTKLDIEILDANELISRTSEQARLLGVDFFSVFSRGSQFKVESIMFRIAKPENFLLVSPSRKQVGGQNALECLPLVMEPQSDFYTSPLLVLDFQSLYPSVMIAYNLCYSTFLGRITNWRGMNKMGFTEYKRQQGLLNLLKDYINITPNGMMYVKKEIRMSLLAKMLTEILETRVMVKSGMKQDKDDKSLQQLLNNRQLALKLLANVTYGYTSASFSGRMPCSEIADSIVQTGRETLERAVAYIHSVERWGAEVVYGDTDSLFIYLKGKTRDQAFDIGNEMAKAITDMNPRPVKLKFEKVYHPCVLLAKKRYVGYKYESRDQAKPGFEAKGIETVRRDGTPAEQKIEEKVLRMLFDTADLSRVKSYFQSQCRKIMTGAVSVQDFCFAREVKLGTYSNKGPPPAGALISTRRMLKDARAEPQYGERVPYVVITGAPGARLIDRCVAPEDLISNPHWALDSEYYISKNLIPPLERIFNLVGANVRQWYDEMPKIRRIRQSFGAKKMTLESYMQSSHCDVCNRRLRPSPEGQRGSRRGHDRSTRDIRLCHRCARQPRPSIMRLQGRVAYQEKKMAEVTSVCRTCSGTAPLEAVACDSKDCPVFWTRSKQERKLGETRAHDEPIVNHLMAKITKKDLEW